MAKVVHVCVVLLVDVLVELLRGRGNLDTLNEGVHSTSCRTFSNIWWSKDAQASIWFGIVDLLGVEHVEVVVQKILIEL